MIDVDAALERILAEVVPLPVVEVALLEALGLTLAGDIIATSNIPPFRNAAMDGYAVRAADVAGAGPSRPIQLAVVADVPAGYPSAVVVGPGQAARIMTGAQVPDGAEAIVRFEETDEALARGGRGRAAVQIFGPVRPGDNVRLPGEDIRAGEVVLPAGTVLGPADIGVLASLGHGRIAVHRRPRVAILATGDEVVGIDAEPGPGQIRDSNSYAVAAQVRRYGGEPVLLGIARDRLAELRRVLAAGRDYDLVISSAGVSVGDYDVVKQALHVEGHIDLWQVNMKPGKPLAFGRLGSTPYLGLPGNPVAAMVSFQVFGRPLLLRLLGRRDVANPCLRARAGDRLDNGSGRRHFVRVAVAWDPATGYVARIAGAQGSGVLTSMVHADGLAVVREGVTAVPAGDLVDVLLLDWQ